MPRDIVSRNKPVPNGELLLNKPEIKLALEGCIHMGAGTVYETGFATKEASWLGKKVGEDFGCRVQGDFTERYWGNRSS